MKATGIVRKIDDLGRVVIPKEIRKNLKIRVGDPLEIFIEEDGYIVLQKYAPMGDILDLMTRYAKSLSETSGFSVCITDKETIVAAAGAGTKEYLARELSENVTNIMNERVIWSTMDNNTEELIIDDDPLKYYSQIIAPIISEGDALGAVILFSTDTKKKITDTQYQLVKSATNFLASQLEA